MSEVNPDESHVDHKWLLFSEKLLNNEAGATSGCSERALKGLDIRAFEVEVYTCELPEEVEVVEELRLRANWNISWQAWTPNRRLRNALKGGLDDPPEPELLAPRAEIA